MEPTRTEGISAITLTRSAPSSPNKPKIRQILRHGITPTHNAVEVKRPEIGKLYYHSPQSVDEYDKRSQNRRSGQFSNRINGLPSNGINGHVSNQTNEPKANTSGRQHQKEINVNTISNSTPHTEVKETLESIYRNQYSCPGGTDYTRKLTNTNGVGAYVLQPDGTMAAIRWDDKSALESNQPVLSVLRQEQQAQMSGKTTGKIQSTSNSKARLPSDMLNWLATDEEEFRGNVESVGGRRRLRTRSKSSGAIQNTGRSKPATAHQISPQYNIQPLNGHAFTRSQSTISHQANGKQDHNGNAFSPCQSFYGNQGRIYVKVMQTPNAMHPIQHIHHTNQQSVASSKSSATPIQRYFSEPAQRPHSPSSAQVQESYWSPEGSPARVPQRQQRLPLGNRYNRQSSQQQRQLSLDKAPGQQYHSPDKATPVWEYFKYYERCATSDF